MKDIKWLFLDLDNTILDFKSASKEAFYRMCSSFGEEADNFIYSQYEYINHQVWSAFERNEIPLNLLKSERFRRLFDFLDWSYDPETAGQRYLAFLSENHDFLPGAQEALPILKQHYSLAIITNGIKEVQRPRIANSQLEALVEHIFISDEIGYSKPDGAFFQYCFDQIEKVDPQDVLVVGDNHVADIEGGKNAGCKTAWIHATDKSPIADVTIKNLTELTNLLLR